MKQLHLRQMLIYSASALARLKRRDIAINSHLFSVDSRISVDSRKGSVAFRKGDTPWLLFRQLG
jgi:hypothetical protein